jgi:uncharacterized heparinase superfamily protein
VETVDADRQDSNGAQWLEAAHDGWLRQYGMRHRRRLYLSESGDDLRGEDLLEADREMPAPGFVVRFHLHPTVVASLQQNESGVLLRLPSGAGWRLLGIGARVAIEESVYLAGELRRSQQVALHAEPGTTSVQWQISRVSLQAPAAEERS